ncbi:hypothetical protein P3L10_015272 [Capsicum annuum]
MLEARDLFDQQIWWEPNCGHASVWYDNWTQLGALHYFLPIDLPRNHHLEEVSQCFSNEAWNSERLQVNFGTEVSNHVEQNINCTQQMDLWDKAWWMLNVSGNLSVKSAWDFVRNKKQSLLIYERSWMKGVPFKISFFIWRLWQKRLPVGEVLLISGISNQTLCSCCNSGSVETFEHLFITCSKANSLWIYFANCAGITGPFLQIKDTVFKWWNSPTSAKLKPIFRVIPLFILWQIWKFRNTITHGGKMTFSRSIREVTRNLVMLANTLYPWLRAIPQNWPELLFFLQNYSPITVTSVVYWTPPFSGFKCNSDGASKGNPGPISSAFCIRDDQGNFEFAECRKIGVATNLMAEVIALRIGLQYCIDHNLFPLILETDSLAVKQFVEGNWHTPWLIAMETRRIHPLMKGMQVLIKHTYREGNGVADFIANRIFSFAGTDRLTYSTYQQLPKQAKALLNMDKFQVEIVKVCTK